MFKQLKMEIKIAKAETLYQQDPAKGTAMHAKLKQEDRALYNKASKYVKFA